MDRTRDAHDLNRVIKFTVRCLWLNDGFRRRDGSSDAVENIMFTKFLESTADVNLHSLKKKGCLVIYVYSRNIQLKSIK